MNLLGVVLLASLITVACAQEPDPPQATGPAVSQPVEPGVAPGDLRRLPKAKPYKPGDPVRVMPDLREDDQEAPHVSPPVAPKVREGDLRKAPPLPAVDPNQPPRVWPDMKESPPQPPPTPGKSGSNE